MSKKNNPFQCPHPHGNNPLWGGPGFSRRQFFQIAGSGLVGYYFTRVARPLEVLAASGVTTRNTAKNCIFVLLSGAPSHVDTFDLKEGPWTPSDFAPTSFGEIRFPQGLLPNMADQLGRVTILRSVRAWALVHSLAQVWAQIARNPTAALGKISPNMGAVVALENSTKRTSTDLLPGFIALNPRRIVGSGYFPSTFAPFNVAANAEGLANTTHPDGAERFNTRWQLLQDLDGGWRQDSTVGRATEDMDDFYQSAKDLMYNADVDKAFQFTQEESERYGDSEFGNACLVARNILRADIGTRFIQINLTGWDHHSNIYAPNGGIYLRSRQLDGGLPLLLDDLAATPSSTAGKSLLDETLVVAMGEFGRTVGNPNNQQGRDHFLQQFAIMAGGGVAAGRVIGATDPTGAATADPGWSQGRDIKIEDITATIYSALGIDWTTVRLDDPFNRGFEYVPFAKDGLYRPIEEVFE